MVDDDFQKHEVREAARRAEEQRHNFGNAMAGRETGRRGNFGFRDKYRREATEKKEREALLGQALKFASEAHRKAYEAALGALEEAEYAIADALNESAQRLAETGQALVVAQAELDGILDRASTLPNGTRIFLDDDGFAYTEDDRQLTDDEMATVDWKEGADGRQTFRQSSARRAQTDADVAAANERHAWLIGRDTWIGEIEDELHDPDNVPSLERSQELEKQLREATSEIHKTMADDAKFDSSEPAADAVLTIDPLAPGYS